MWVISEGADTEVMNFHLEQIAKAHPRTLNVVVCDQAGWHRSKRLLVPKNVALVLLPPYSPELNPVEPVWLSLRDHFTGNTDFEHLPALDARVESAIQFLFKHPDTVKSITRRAWANV